VTPPTTDGCENSDGGDDRDEPHDAFSTERLGNFFAQ